jgi:hypothetical protein
MLIVIDEDEYKAALAGFDIRSTPSCCDACGTCDCEESQHSDDELDRGICKGLRSAYVDRNDLESALCKDCAEVEIRLREDA